MSKQSEYCDAGDPRIFKVTKIMHDNNLGLDRVIGETQDGNLLAEVVKAGTPITLGMNVRYEVLCYHSYSGYEQHMGVFVPIQ
ncbi:MAG: hypothetical protein P4L67_00510 [Candidatus Pacebacteria bacterium]|nr:hypothetical protein [Candidatus Paceibacterota bacterium]